MRRFSPFVLAGAFYLLVSVAITWPLASTLGSHVANDLGDSLLNMFIMAWNARTLPLTDAWWNMPQFYPATGTTAFSEHLLGLSPITTPVLRLTNNPVLAYNLALFLSFPLSALAAHALAWSLTKRHDAALVAGLAFGFAPYRTAQLSHVQVLSSYWMPLSLAGLVRYLDDRRLRWLVLFAGAWLMQALACGYYFFFLSVLIGLWLLWFLVGRERWSDVARVLGAWALAVLAIAPVLYGYWRIQREYGMRRWPDEIAAFSADVASVFKAPPALRLWGWLDAIDRPESELFPGLTIVVLIVAGAVVGWRSLTARQRRLRVVPVLVAAAVAFLIVSPTPILFGPWKLEIFGVRLLSVGTPHKPLSVAIALLAISAALSPTARALWTRRSRSAFFLLAAIAMWLFALGPAPTLMGEPILYKAPYTWLMYIPGVQGIRVPARFWMLAVLCLASTAALATVALTARWPRLRRTIVAAACIGVLVDSWPTPVATPAAPGRRPNHTSAQSRLDLPSIVPHDLLALYWAVFHQRPLLNGYSGYFAPHYWVLRHLVEQGDHDVLTAMANFGDLEVVVDHAADDDRRVRAFVSSHPTAEEVFTNDAYSSYRIRASGQRTLHPRIDGPTVPIASATATIGSELLDRITDGDLVSRWEGGRGQRPGDSLTIDLGSTRQVRGVELDIGGYVADFPRRLRIETSADGASWQERWSGTGGTAALAGALIDARLMPLFFEFSPAAARYVRLTQLGADPVFYWSVAELRVYGR
jgi:hypothetical protein